MTGRYRLADPKCYHAHHARCGIVTSGDMPDKGVD